MLAGVYFARPLHQDEPGGPPQPWQIESGLAMSFTIALVRLIPLCMAREPVEFWGLPEGRHTAAIRERPDEYERRVIGFFDDALLDRA